MGPTASSPPPPQSPLFMHLQNLLTNLLRSPNPASPKSPATASSLNLSLTENRQRPQERADWLVQQFQRRRPSLEMKRAKPSLLPQLFPSASLEVLMAPSGAMWIWRRCRVSRPRLAQRWTQLTPAACHQWPHTLWLWRTRMV